MSPGDYEFILWLSQYVGWTNDNFPSLLVVTGRSVNAIALADPLGQPEHYGRVECFHKNSPSWVSPYSFYMLVYASYLNIWLCVIEVIVRRTYNGEQGGLWISLICWNFRDWLWRRKLKVITLWLENKILWPQLNWEREILKDIVTMTPLIFLRKLFSELLPQSGTQGLTDCKGKMIAMDTRSSQHDVIVLSMYGRLGNGVIGPPGDDANT